MRVLTRDQAQSLDQLSMYVHGISGEILMGNAGEKIDSHVYSILSDIHSPYIGIICGKGNNGGDGFAAGHLFHNRGFKITIYALMEKSEVVDDSKIFHDNKFFQYKKFSW